MIDCTALLAIAVSSLALASSPATPALAQTPAVRGSVAPGATLPPGHPPIGDVTALGAGSDDSEAALPHIPQNRVAPDSKVAPGEVDVHLVDPNDAPIAGASVTLGVLRTSVALGESHSRTSATTDREGRVSFKNLERGSGFSYRVSTVATTADSAVSATYATAPFQLALASGQSVELHRFPVSSSLDGLMLAVAGVETTFEVRDDVIEVQQEIDIVNAGTTSWGLGAGLTMALPAGFKGLRAGESMDDLRVTSVDGVGARWLGSIAPGETRLAYDFKLPYSGEAAFEALLEMPPRVLAARVRVAARKGMELAVDGFPPAEIESSASGQKALTSTQQGSPEKQIRSVHVRVSGLPVEGPMRWVAFGLAIAIAAGGLFFGLRPPSANPAGRFATDETRRRARQSALDDLRTIELARRSGELGPLAYERERARLIDRIADTFS